MLLIALYLIIKNIYLVLIIRFVSWFIIIKNRKPYTTTFYKLLYLVPTFLLPLFQEFYLSLLNFYKLLLNLCKNNNYSPIGPKFLITYYNLDPLYYILIKIVATNKIISTVIPVFVAKETDTKNKHL